MHHAWERLLYLTATRTGIIHVVNKLAKFTRKPGKIHFKALVHVLRYLRDNVGYGVKFYSNASESPINQMLKEQKLVIDHLLLGFSDSSWNNDADTGRSTGCYLITYKGGVVGHSSILPDPIALSSVEAEYNESCIAFMAASHLVMLLNELKFVDQYDHNRRPTPISLDSTSAIPMGNSFRDTRHTRHIMRRHQCVREQIELGIYITL